MKFKLVAMVLLVGVTLGAYADPEEFSPDEFLSNGDKLGKAVAGVPAAIMADGAHGWKVMITNDVDATGLPIEMPDNVGNVTIDLNGHDLRGNNGEPAIRIVPDDEEGEPTRITVLSSDGNAILQGGVGTQPLKVAYNARGGAAFAVSRGVTLKMYYDVEVGLATEVEANGETLTRAFRVGWVDWTPAYNGTWTLKRKEFYGSVQMDEWTIATYDVAGLPESAEPKTYVKVGTSDYGNPDNHGCGTVTGGNAEYSIGDKVSLSAKPAKGYVFEGWHTWDANLYEENCGGWSDEPISRSPNYTYVVDQQGGEVPLMAMFIAVIDDHIALSCEAYGCCGYGSFDVGDDEAYIAVGIDSGSLATLTATGLPTGMKLQVAPDNPHRYESVGAPTKAGVYYVTVSAKNANGLTATATLEILVGVDENGDYDDIQDIPLIDPYWLCTGAEYEWQGEGMASISGLPAGLKFDAKTGTVSGVPTKPGVAKLTYTDKRGRKAEQTVIVGDGGWCRVSVATECQTVDGRSNDEGGTVSGDGMYAAGTTVALKATPAKGCAFRGWGDWDNPSAFDTTLTFQVPNESSVDVTANFVEQRADELQIDMVGEPYSSEIGEPVDVGPDAYWEIYSGSAYTVSVSGLPPGVKFDAKTRTFSGAPTKAGIYVITVTAKNGNGYFDCETGRWFVGVEEDGDYDEIGFDYSAWWYGLITGEEFSWEAPESVASISGLPAGLKFDAQTRIVSGVLTTPGFFTLTFTASDKRRTVVTVHVVDAGSVYVPDNGVFHVGSKATLKAAVRKRQTFLGWFDGDRLLSTSPSYSCTIYRVPEARYIATADDHLWIYGDCERRELNVAHSVSNSFEVESVSSVAVSVAGLPQGIKYDALANDFSGMPSKTGVYYVTMSAKNLSGCVFAATQQWIVDGADTGDYDDIGIGPAFGVGEGFEQHLATGIEFRWRCEGLVSASGLPDGLKFDTAKGEIYGVPAKPGRYAITLTDTQKRKTVRNVIVKDSGMAYVSLDDYYGEYYAYVDDYDWQNSVALGHGNASYFGGTVSGEGWYSYGSTVKLRAKAAKGFVFAGWEGLYGDGLVDSPYGDDYRNADCSFVMTTDVGQQLYPRFIMAEADYLNVLNIDGEEWSITEDGVAGGLRVESASLPTVTAKGMPVGLNFEGARLVVTDRKKLKPGTTDVAINVNNVSGFAETRKVKITVVAPMLAVMPVSITEDGKMYGSVTGDGTYWPGTTVTLKAKPEKGAAFVGWFRDDELLSSDATLTIVTEASDSVLEARFIGAASDRLRITGEDHAFAVGQNVDIASGAYFTVDSGSAATVSVSGLPQGVKFDAKARAFSGAPAKAGIYYVVMSAKNANGFTHSFTEIWNVGGTPSSDYNHINWDEKWLDAFGSLATGIWFEWRSDEVASVSGLPDGLKFDAKTGLVSGKPTKPGKFTILFKDRARYTAEKTVVVKDSGSVYVGVDLGKGMDRRGTVSGSGVYRYGDTVKLSANAAKGYVFSGWHEDDEFGDMAWITTRCGYASSDDEGYVYCDPHLPNLAFETVPEWYGTPTRLYARFILPEEDYLAGANEWCGVGIVNWGWDGEYLDSASIQGMCSAYGDATFAICLDSGSAVAMTAKGLPPGMTLAGPYCHSYHSEGCCYLLAVKDISKLKLNPGVTEVVLTAKNASGMTGEHKVCIVVPNLRSEVLPGLEQDKEAYGVVMCGVDFDADRIDCTHEVGWTVKVTGLPAGLKYDAKKNRITGVPTKAGTYTVTFTASKKGNKNQVATITLNVEALPKWATGTFTGNVKLKMENGELEEVYGTATMTVGAAGKISGKIAIDGTNWTFSAASYASIEWPDGLEQLDDLDNLGDDRVFVVEATAKAGKATRAIVVEVGNGVGDGVRGAPALPAVAEGTFGECEVKMWRNVWKDTGMAQLLATWKGAYDYLTDNGEPLTLTIDANGGVKVAGTLVSGRKLSFSTSLLYADEDWYWAILYAPPATETVKKGKKKVKVAYPAFYEETVFQNYPGAPLASERIAYRRQGVLASVSADSTGSGTIKYSTAYGQAPEGATVTVTATPAKNSVFAYWTLYGVIAGYSASYKLVMCDGDFTGLEAVFRAKSEFKQKPPEPFVVDDEGGDPFAGLRVGIAFRARIDVDPEWHPVKFAAKNLPDGLKLNATTGVISGVPTKAGAKTVSFTATSTVNPKLVSPALKLQVNVAKRGG